VALILSNAGVACLAGGIWIGATGLAVAGALLWAGAALIVAYVLAYRWIPLAVLKGRIRHASPDDPQYVIRSDKTDHVAIHKATALTKISP
jgi:hypothetical protein